MTGRGHDAATEVPARATPVAEAALGVGDHPWAEATIWTERMLSALLNGVVRKARLRHEGGKWYSLIDKVWAPKTLALASCFACGA